MTGCETHTGIVVLVGDKAYKVKKPVVTDFLDFSTVVRREQACAREFTLNSRLAPSSYLGVGHFSDPAGGPPEPVVVMRRHPDTCRLATMVGNDEPVEAHLLAIARILARFHAGADRGRAIDAQAKVEAVAARWRENLAELDRFADEVLPAESIAEVQRLATRYIAGRSMLFAQRITDRRIVDGHADLLADDIFCLPGGPELLDCLEFDDDLRYVDGMDDAAFLAMDLEFLGRKDLARYFLDQYTELTGDPAPASLKDFFIAYRAVVRAKVACIRHTQGGRDADADAERHLEIARQHLRAGTIRLILVGGGPGTGKTTLARSLAEEMHAHVISTDDVRRRLAQSGVIDGATGMLDDGLYAPENVEAVYDEVLRNAHLQLSAGRSVILDGTWRDPRQRERARTLAGQTAASMREFACTATLQEASARIRNRPASASDATPAIAAAIAEHHDDWQGAHPIDTRRPLADAVAEAHEVCCLVI